MQVVRQALEFSDSEDFVCRITSLNHLRLESSSGTEEKKIEGWWRQEMEEKIWGGKKSLLMKKEIQTKKYIHRSMSKQSTSRRLTEEKRIKNKCRIET
jgi:hypothetical protein